MRTTTTTTTTTTVPIICSMTLMVAAAPALRAQSGTTSTTRRRTLHPINRVALTWQLRRPCHECIGRGRSFFIYGRRSLHNSCN